jgi:hypothetical protein
VNRVPFDPGDLPPPLADEFARWQRRADDAQKLMEAQEATASGGAPDPDVRAQVYRDHKTWLLKHIFADRCAYCQGDLAAQTRGAAEHYRPKKGAIQVESNGSVTPCKGPDGQPHRGYWWLAYRWENLVPACPDCNGPKDVRFPIEGERVYARSEAPDVDALDATEEPLLLHPFRGPDPAEHIGFGTDGRAFAKDGSEYGERTIRTCELNRYGLVKDRKRRQEDAKTALVNALMLQQETGRTIDDQMRRHDGPDAEYAQAVRDALAVHEGSTLEQLLSRKARRER